MSDPIKRMNLDEFRRLGFLQEANRLFFHPRGLALEVVVDSGGGQTTLGGIWDYREDPEGIVFGEGRDAPEAEKAATVEAEFQRHVAARTALLGSTIQRVAGSPEAGT